MWFFGSISAKKKKGGGKERKSKDESYWEMLLINIQLNFCNLIYFNLVVAA
jgi:hypothetical protein